MTIKKEHIRVADNTKWFEGIFRSHFTSLVWFAMKFVNDKDTGREIVHEVFINVWEKRDELNNGDPIQSYLYTSVRNRSLNWLRDRKKFMTSRESLEDDLTDQVSQDYHGFETEELEARIMQAVVSLPEKCREVFEMSRFEEKKYAEIASELQISVKTVEAQISKALRLLRESLSDYTLLLLFILIFKILYESIRVFPLLCVLIVTN